MCGNLKAGAYKNSKLHASFLLWKRSCNLVVLYLCCILFQQWGAISVFDPKFVVPCGCSKCLMCDSQNSKIQLYCQHCVTEIVTFSSKLFDYPFSPIHKLFVFYIHKHQKCFIYIFLCVYIVCTLTSFHSFFLLSLYKKINFHHASLGCVSFISLEKGSEQSKSVLDVITQ